MPNAAVNLSSMTTLDADLPFLFQLGSVRPNGKGVSVTTDPANGDTAALLHIAMGQDRATIHLDADNLELLAEALRRAAARIRKEA